MIQQAYIMEVLGKASKQKHSFQCKSKLMQTRDKRKS